MVHGMQPFHGAKVSMPQVHVVHGEASVQLGVWNVQKFSEMSETTTNPVNTDRAGRLIQLQPFNVLSHWYRSTVALRAPANWPTIVNTLWARWFHLPATRAIRWSVRRALFAPKRVSGRIHHRFVSPVQVNKPKNLEQKFEKRKSSESIQSESQPIFRSSRPILNEIGNFVCGPFGSAATANTSVSFVCCARFCRQITVPLSGWSAQWFDRTAEIPLWCRRFSDRTM